MIKLSNILKETYGEEEIQTYIDVISMNPGAPYMKKYKKQLKDKYGIDYDREYGMNDSDLIKNANLDDIKSKDDFLSFDNYQKYAKKIFQLRGLSGKQPNHIDKEVTFDDVNELGKRLGFKVKHRQYSGKGNYAQVSGDRMEVPSVVDVNTLIHEMGHIYYNNHRGDGKASTITNASSPYRIGYTSEVFAENFMHYFIAPSFLKRNLPEVYNELNSEIKSTWKREIKNLIK